MQVYTKEFEYNKRVFNKYYKGKFKYRNITPYIIFQVLTTLAFIIPGIMFAIIYWFITNPITKCIFWKEELKYNKGLISKYQFIFNEDQVLIKRNSNEELPIYYKTFKKIRNDQNGVYLLSKQKDFFIPNKEIEELPELVNLLKKVRNAKVKIVKQKTKKRSRKQKR